MSTLTGGFASPCRGARAEHFEEIDKDSMKGSDDADTECKSMHELVDSSDSDSEDMNGCADDDWVSDMVVSQRWECDVCLETFGESEPHRSLNDERCVHSFCSRCLRECIKWGVRCPFDDTPISNLCACGVMHKGDFIFHVKRTEAVASGNIICSNENCAGVLKAGSSDESEPVPCPECAKKHCCRRSCGAPWTDGHRCWDNKEDLAARKRKEELRQEEIKLRAEWDARHGRTRVDLFQDPDSIESRIKSLPCFRPCPKCGVMAEHDGGCNMVYHDSCQTKWCFICLSVGTCSDYQCCSVNSPQASE